MARPFPVMRPAARLMSASARWPRIMATIEAGAHINRTPHTRLAIALLLFCGGCCQPPGEKAAWGTGCATPQYGHVSTKSARFRRQLAHAFRACLSEVT